MPFIRDRPATDLIAKVGYEIEIGSMRAHPYMPKGTVLIDAQNWTMETDTLPPNQAADIEFVLSPATEFSEIERALDEIIQLVAEIRSRAMVSTSRLVAFSDIELDGCTYRVRDEVRASWIEVRNLHCSARLQVTYGIALTQMAEYFDRFFPTKLAMAIHIATYKIEALYRRAKGMALPSRVRGFMHLLNYYVIRAACGVVPRVESVHVYFPLYMRSDFCSVFDKLLDESERRIVEYIVCASADAVLPPFMVAHEASTEQLLFKEPYFTQQWIRHSGPTLQEWLRSIVFGREDASMFRKDLMSPPPGYRLHDDDGNANYGGGAMGVDPINQLALFEIRSSPQRYDLPLNVQIKYCAALEFAKARSFNKLLTGDGCFASVISCRERYELLCAYERLFAALVDLYGAIESSRSGNFAEDRPTKVTAAVGRTQICREALEAMIELTSTQVEALIPIIAELDSWVDEIARFQDSLGKQRVPLAAARRRLVDFERKLWATQCAMSCIADELQTSEQDFARVRHDSTVQPPAATEAFQRFTAGRLDRALINQ